MIVCKNCIGQLFTLHIKGNHNVLFFIQIQFSEIAHIVTCKVDCFSNYILPYVTGKPIFF